METMRNRWLYLVVGFTVGQLLMGAKPLAAQGDCLHLVLDAANKVWDTPTHLYATMNMGGTTQTVEMIYAAGAIYTKYGGKWSSSPMSMQEMKDLEQKNLQTSKAPRWTPKTGHRSTPENRPSAGATETLTPTGGTWSTVGDGQRLERRQETAGSGAGATGLVAAAH